MKLFVNDAQLQAADIIGWSMNSMRPIAAFLVLAALVSPFRSAAAEEGVAVAIIYDTSGSMKNTVKDFNGHQTPKYVIANRALESIANQLQTFATNAPGSAPRRIEAGVFRFSNNDAVEAVPFGPFHPKPIHDFAKSFTNPSGSTPLGNALTTATRAVMNSPLNHKHVLIITDGENTAGPEPGLILPRLRQEAQASNTSLGVHFVAFDVDAKVFDSVKKQGATVVAAADEKQLNTQLDFIMQRKILLEEEEPPKKP